jgi:hypothetical protein
MASRSRCGGIFKRLFVRTVKTQIVGSGSTKADIPRDA